MLKIVCALRRLFQRGIARLVAREAPAIAEWREFELDHLGAHFREYARACRPGDELAKIDYAVALEHGVACPLLYIARRSGSSRLRPASASRCSSRPMRSYPQNGSFSK